MNAFWHRGRDGSRGQMLPEFTLVIPLFLAIVLGIAEGGYYVAASTAVNSATHEGARLGLLETTSSRGVIRTRVQNAAAPLVTIPDASITLRLAKKNDDGTYAAMADCDDVCYDDRVRDDLLVVNTDYQHVPLVGYLFPGLTIPASARAELMVEGDGT